KRFEPGEEAYLVDFHELIIITKGQGIFKLEEELIPYRRGTILLMPPNKWKQWLEFSPDIDGYLLIFEEEFISSFFNDALFLYRFHFFYHLNSPSYLQTDEGRLRQLLAIRQQVAEELPALKPDSDHLLRALLYQFLILINRDYIAQFQLEGRFFADNLVLRFRRMLEASIRSQHQVGDYADSLQVSKSHLNKVLKKHFGKSCSEIVKERLLIEIKRDLLYSPLSIAEISHQLHFSEPSNFNRFFKEMVGQTPREFRQQNANG
ncbi:MAG: AraC family transcriptional regulator, partial [Bacteroidota bacterium]